MPTIIDLPDLPNTVATFVRQDPVIDPEMDEAIDTVETEVACQYTWRIIRTKPPKVTFYISQEHNPWEYVPEDDDSEVVAELAKVGLTGAGFQRGEVRYGGEPNARVGITQDHLDAMSEILIGPAV